MKLSEVPWGTIGKVVGAAAVASGLFGGGYLTGTPSTPTAKQATVIEIPLKVFVNGNEAKYTVTKKEK